MNETQPQSRKNLLWDVGWSIILIAIVVLIILRIFVYQQVNVVGPSMQSNYFSGEQLLVNEIDKTLPRGQVVAVYEDKDVAANANYFTRFTARFFLKRVIGLPGEEIEVVGDSVIIYNSQYPDGTVLVENYIDDEVKRTERYKNEYYPRTKIADGHYFLMGDNRSDSLDSRVKGAFPAYSIFGKETAKYLPINKFRMFELPRYAYQTPSDQINSLRADLYLKYQEKN